MTMDELRKLYNYDFECCISEEFKDYNEYDEFSCATMWLENYGVEYNFCIQGDGTNSSAIYKLDTNEDCSDVTTDYSTFIHYEIDFNDKEWVGKLENAMSDALIKFFNL